MDACSFCMVAQKIMESELHHEATEPLGWRRRDARLDVGKYFALGDGFVLACRCLHGFKRGEPLLKQFNEVLICGFSSMSFPTFNGNIRGPRKRSELMALETLGIFKSLHRFT